MIILVCVENEPEKEALGILLKQKGAEVLFSDIGYPAIQKAMQSNPRAILLEHCPEREPLRFLQLLRKNPRLEKTPVVMWGAPFDRRSIMNLKGEGAKGFFERPVALQSMFAELPALNETEGAQGIYVRSESVKSATGEVTLFNSNPEITQLSESNRTSEKARERLCPDTEQRAILDAAKVNPIDALMRMVEHVDSLYAFPFTVAKILEVVNDPGSGASDVARIITSDTAVSTAMLRVANSVEYAGRGRRIADVNEAIVRIGFQETKKIAVSTSVMNLFEGDDKSLSFSRMEFWYHSLAVAILSEQIATNMSFPHPTQAFTCGLLHEVGLMVMDEFFNLVLNKVMTTAAEKDLTITQAEEALLGFNHIRLASELFEKWSLPRALAQPILGHIDYENPPQGTVGEEASLCRILGVSNDLANMLGLGQFADMRLKSISEETLKKLKAGAGFTKGQITSAMEKVTVFCQYMKLNSKAFPERWLAPLGDHPMVLVDFAEGGQDGLRFFLQSQGLKLHSESMAEKESLMRYRTVLVNLPTDMEPDAIKESLIKRLPSLGNPAVATKIPLVLVARGPLDLRLEGLASFVLDASGTLPETGARLVQMLDEWYQSS